MLSAIHTKIPLAILGTLIAIVVAVAYQGRKSEKPAAAATKAAAILERQKRDAEKQTRRDEEFRQRVEKDKKRHDSFVANEGKTWTSYVS